MSLAPFLDRSLVEALHVLDPRLTQERAEEAGHEARLDVADVGVDPGDDVAVEDVEALPERLALAGHRADLGQDLRVPHHGHAELGRDLGGAIGAVGVDDDELVDERHPVDEGALDAADDKADRPLLIERRQPDADRQAGLLLERHELARVAELAGVERVLGEPLVDDRRQRVAALRVRVGVGERALRRPQLVEGRGAERLLRLHHDDRRARLADDRLRHRPEQVAPVAAMPALRRLGTGTHDDEVVVGGLADDRGAHARPLAEDADHAPPAAVLAHECVERLLLAGERPLADALRHDVHDHHLRAEALPQVAGEANGELGVWTAADGDQDRADVVEAALLDDRDVARRLADDGVDRGGEDRWRSRLGTRQPRLGGLRLGAGGLGRGARPRPAEDDEIGPFLADRLDDAVGRPTPDADHRPQLHALLVAEVEDALEQAPRDAGLVRALGQADALGDLDDAEGGDLGRPPIRDAGADPDEIARGARVGERQEDPVRLAPAGCHQRPSDSARIAFQRVTRYGLSSSNSRACSSMTRSAWSVVISSVWLMKPAVRPK